MRSPNSTQNLSRCLAFMLFFIAPCCMVGPSQAKLGWAEISSPAVFMKTLAAQRCPKAFAISLSKTTIYCLKTKLTLPKADVTPDCDGLDQGVLGFSWVSKKRPEKPVYSCPDGAKKTVKNGVSYCRFEALFVPTENKTLRPYCSYLKRGYIGYSYSL